MFNFPSRFLLPLLTLPCSVLSAGFRGGGPGAEAGVRLFVPCSPDVLEGLESIVDVDALADAETLDDAQIDNVANTFVGVYNGDTNTCDRFFRSITNIEFLTLEELLATADPGVVRRLQSKQEQRKEQLEQRQLGFFTGLAPNSTDDGIITTTPLSFFFRITYSCRGCPSDTDLFDDGIVRRLQAQLDLPDDGSSSSKLLRSQYRLPSSPLQQPQQQQQHRLLDDSGLVTDDPACVCSDETVNDDNLNRALTSEEFTTAFNVAIQEENEEGNLPNVVIWTDVEENEVICSVDADCPGDQVCALDRWNDPDNQVNECCDAATEVPGFGVFCHFIIPFNFPCPGVGFDDLCQEKGNCNSDSICAVDTSTSPSLAPTTSTMPSTSPVPSVSPAPNASPVPSASPAPSADQCLPTSCSIYATCSNTPDGIACECNPGFEGDGLVCTTINECEDSPCDGNATCTDTFGSFECECNTGFEGNGTVCEDIDECVVNEPCSEFATCVNTPGLFVCSCNDGYVGNGALCFDFNECADDPCSADATCENTDGSFNCTCNEGYEGDGFVCSDVSECDDNPCDSNAVCANSVGSFECTCESGYEGDGITCEDIDECESGPCSGAASCTNTDGSFTCTCNDGFSGDGFDCTDDSTPSPTPGPSSPAFTPSVFTGIPSSTPSLSSEPSLSDAPSKTQFPSSLPTVTPFPSLGAISLNNEITCVSVIDETSLPASTISSSWNTFRADYPDRPFCLLQPEASFITPSDLKIPADFTSDANTIFSDQVKRDLGDSSQTSDWFDLCDLETLRSQGVTRVALFIDNSGSLTTFEVSASRALFVERLSANGIELVSSIENTIENWISPFLTDLVVIPSPAPSSIRFLSEGEPEADLFSESFFASEETEKQNQWVEELLLPEEAVVELGNGNGEYDGGNKSATSAKSFKNLWGLW